MSLYLHSACKSHRGNPHSTTRKWWDETNTHHKQQNQLVRRHNEASWRRRAASRVGRSKQRGQIVLLWRCAILIVPRPECLRHSSSWFQARFRVTAEEHKNYAGQTIPTPPTSDEEALRKRPSLLHAFSFRIFSKKNIFWSSPLLFMALSSCDFLTPSPHPSLALSGALPPSLRVTRPIWAVWWSWEHRSLSGELSGALFKTQRADYCSCQSH